MPEHPAGRVTHARECAEGDLMSEIQSAALELAEYLETVEKTDAVTIGLSDAALAAKALRALAASIRNEPADDRG